MPKRKRDPRPVADHDSSSSASDSDTAPHAPRATAKQLKQLPPKIELGKKTLTKALRVSRGFERQKLSRRRKTAEKEGKERDVERIDAEIGALKKVDYNVLAQTHLYKTLLRIKSIAEHPALPPWIRVPEAKGAAPDAAVMNVQARLFNANPTKEAMAGVIKGVREVLELGEEGGPRAKRARKEEKGKKGKKAVVVEEEGEEEEEESSGEEEAEGEWDSDEFAGFSDRIAASSDEESGEEGGGDDDGASKLKRPYKPVRDLSFTPPSSREASPSPSPDPDFSGAESESASVSASASPEPVQKAKAKAQTPVVVANKSTFLPSLSAVGYISGSDSEAEDLDEQVAPARKNRRGQRARQQLWEKKYGAGAKHVAAKKEKEKNDRNAGWDAQRGAVDGDSGRGKKGRFGRGNRSGGRGPQASDANLIELGKKKDHRDDKGKLHPSWEAKKLAKEKASTVAFQGKKITFD